MRTAPLAGLVAALLAASAILVVAAAAAMPEGYAWRRHSISESAAQALRHAWVARSAFLAFGAAVLVLALWRRHAWPRAAVLAHATFAVCMIGTAAFSHRPWLPDVSFDAVEDLLHSITATGMGFAFCLGVAARLWARPSGTVAPRLFDAAAVLAGTAMPLLAWQFPLDAGLIQRAMFAVAYAWYGWQAWTPDIR